MLLPAIARRLTASTAGGVRKRTAATRVPY
jgi:hypothetical protein